MGESVTGIGTLAAMNDVGERHHPEEKETAMIPPQDVDPLVGSCSCASSLGPLPLVTADTRTALEGRAFVPGVWHSVP